MKPILTMPNNDVPNYWSINIEIPDEKLIKEFVDYFNKRLEKTLSSPSINEAHRAFLEKNLHIATTKEEAESLFTKARENGESLCVVVSLNSTLLQKKYENLGVISFRYLSWTKKAWEKAKEVYENPFVKKLVDCLLSELITMGCQTLKAYLGM